MLKNKKFLIIVGVTLALFAGLAFALPPRASFIPSELKPWSIAPGVSTSYTVILKHTGILPIPATNQLRITAEGDIANYVTITQPFFPSVFKRGNQVNVVINVTAPQTNVPLVKSGTLVLNRILPNKKVMEVWRSDALPVELTFSPILLLPPELQAKGWIRIAVREGLHRLRGCRLS